MNLYSWGWNTEWQARWTEAAGHGLFPGRVVFESRNMYRVIAEQGENWSILAGTILNRLAERRDYPAVGDWVALRSEPQHDSWLIQQILPRKSAFSRNSAGLTTEEQIIAANCDTVFTVCSLDGGRNFNLRGLERTLTCAWDSGAVPAVILNKTDLCEDLDEAIRQAESIAPAVPIHPLSCLAGEGFDSLAPYLEPGRTVALIGRSGVGKSSIINFLCGQAVVKTGEVREQDHRGRHTTTHRQLVQIPGGGVFLDTPGLRELQLWGEEGSLDQAFPEIENLSAGCRFRDCSHTREPGCAVRQALADGGLDPSRFESYMDLQRELRHLKRKQEIHARLQEKRRLKAFGRMRKQFKSQSS